MSRPIRVITCDRCPTIRYGLQRLLTSESDIEIVAELCEPEAILTDTSNIEADILIIDLNQNICLIICSRNIINFGWKYERFQFVVSKLCSHPKRHFTYIYYHKCRIIINKYKLRSVSTAFTVDNSFINVIRSILFQI